MEQGDEIIDAVSTTTTTNYSVRARYAIEINQSQTGDRNFQPSAESAAVSSGILQLVCMEVPASLTPLGDQEQVFLYVGADVIQGSTTVIRQDGVFLGNSTIEQRATLVYRVVTHEAEPFA